MESPAKSNLHLEIMFFPIFYLTYYYYYFIFFAHVNNIFLN